MTPLRTHIYSPLFLRDHDSSMSSQNHQSRPNPLPAGPLYPKTKPSPPTPLLPKLMTLKVKSVETLQALPPPGPAKVSSAICLSEGFSGLGLGFRVWGFEFWVRTLRVCSDQTGNMAVFLADYAGTTLKNAYVSGVFSLLTYGPKGPRGPQYVLSTIYLPTCIPLVAGLQA